MLIMYAMLIVFAVSVVGNINGLDTAFNTKSEGGASNALLIVLTL